jgi:hypothetical protein
LNSMWMPTSNPFRLVQYPTQKVQNSRLVGVAYCRPVLLTRAGVVLTRVGMRLEGLSGQALADRVKKPAKSACAKSLA